MWACSLLLFLLWCLPCGWHFHPLRWCHAAKPGASLKCGFLVAGWELLRVAKDSYETGADRADGHARLADEVSGPVRLRQRQLHPQLDGVVTEARHQGYRRGDVFGRGAGHAVRVTEASHRSDRFGAYFRRLYPGSALEAAPDGVQHGLAAVAILEGRWRARAGRYAVQENLDGVHESVLVADDVSRRPPRDHVGVIRLRHHHGAETPHVRRIVFEVHLELVHALQVEDEAAS